MIPLAFIAPMWFVAAGIVWLGLFTLTFAMCMAADDHEEPSRLDELETSRTLYSTTGRRVTALPQGDPRVVALMHEGFTPDEAVRIVAERRWS